MPSPVRELDGNILHAFQNPNEAVLEELRQAISLRLMTDFMDLDDRPVPSMGPHVRKLGDDPAQIVVSLAYLEMVWSWVYGTMVVYEEAVQREWMAGNYDGEIRIDNDLKRRAVELIRWSESLRDTYTTWPEALPSPSLWHSEEEERYVRYANRVYVSAVSYVLHHELGHIRLGHFGIVDNADDSAAGRATAIELERDADDFAFRALVNLHDDEDTKSIKAWSILDAVLSALLLLRSPAGFFQGRHPHLHHRAYEVMARLNFREPRLAGYYSYLVSTMLELTFQRVGGEVQPTEPRVFNTHEELEREIVEKIDTWALENCRANRP